MLIYFGKPLSVIYQATKNIVRELLIYKNEIKFEKAINFRTKVDGFLVFNTNSGAPNTNVSPVFNTN